MLDVPEQFEYMTPDEIAECVSGITDATYQELWAVMVNPEFTKRTLGGDGSDGTSDVPDDLDGNLKQAWRFLSDAAKHNIINVAGASSS